MSEEALVIFVTARLSIAYLLISYRTTQRHLPSLPLLTLPSFPVALSLKLVFPVGDLLGSQLFFLDLGKVRLHDIGLLVGALSTIYISVTSEPHFDFLSLLFLFPMLIVPIFSGVVHFVRLMRAKLEFLVRNCS